MGMTRTIRLTAPASTPYIEQVAGSGKGRIFQLTLEIMSLGRTGENDIVIGSESVSRCHIYLKKTAQGWFVQDNNSRNGILVNGRKTPDSVLRTGDTFQVGDFVFKFVDPLAAAPVTTAAMPSEHHIATVNTVEQPVPKTKATPERAPKAAAKVAPKAAAPKATGKRTRGKTLSEVIEAVETLDSVVSLGGANHGREAFINLIRDRVWRPAQIYRDQLAYLVMGLTVGLILASIAVRQFRSRHTPLANPSEAERVTARIETLPSEPYGTTSAGEARKAPVVPMESAPRRSAKRVTRADLNIQKRGRKSRSDKSELSVYLQEGRDYLRENDFESASIAFRFALVIEPGNREAIQGLRTVEAKLGRPVAPRPAPAQVAPPVVRAVPRQRAIARPAPPDKKKQALETLRSASVAFKRRAYQESINLAERARGLNFAGNGAFLSEARALIEEARRKQKEDFEPFLNQANDKFKTGDYQGSKQLCEEMLRLDPAYAEAASCVARAQAAVRGKGKN